MAEIRCPMCSQPNPEDAEVCSSCQARLKPLVAGEGPVQPSSDISETPEPQADRGAPQESDWLSRMRSGAAEPAAAEEEQAAGITPDATPDWLGRLRDTQVPQESQEAEQDWMAEPSSAVEPEAFSDAQDGAVPDWLARIRQREADGSIEQPESAEMDEGDWRSRLGFDEGAEAEAGDADISARLMGQMEASDHDLGFESEELTPEISLPDWDEPAAEETEEPSLIAEEDAFPALGAFDFPQDPDSIGSEASEAELPWTDSIETPSESVSEDMGVVAPSDTSEPADYSEGFEFEWPEIEEPVVSAEMPWESAEEEPELASDAPFDWLEPGDPGMPPQEIVEQTPIMEEAESPPAMTAEERIFGPGVDLDLDVPEVSEPAPPAVVEPPASAALVSDEEPPAEDSSGTDLSLDDIDLPDWLADMKEPHAAPVPGEIVDDAALAPATLPSWLEAMRPVDSFRSVVDMESADSQAVESAGPLAGLRGVLMAEPVVAMPRAATIGSPGLEVTERQFAQAELLQHILIEEEREHPPIQPVRSRMPVLRWVISIILVLSVAMPTFLPSIFFGVFPKNLFPDFSPFYTVVESLPTDAPVLVVFDYPPGYNGELSTLASPFLEHLVERGVPIATLSTTPTGPALAEALLSKYGENWTDYVHLGYLSGGPTAVQVFAAAPRNAVPKGFKIPEEIQAESIDSVWQSELLENVKELSHFSMVAVITAGPENARTWAEQAPDWLEGKPLVMILSAGAEPLVRPYYESTEPQIQGILTGMPAAVGYEIYNNKIFASEQSHVVENKWDAFGFGMFAVLLILLVGGMYGLGVGLWRLGLKIAKGRVND
jgi:hypothetical protein